MSRWEISWRTIFVDDTGFFLCSAWFAKHNAQHWRSRRQHLNKYSKLNFSFVSFYSVVIRLKYRLPDIYRFVRYSPTKLPTAVLTVNHNIMFHTNRVSQKSNIEYTIKVKLYWNIRNNLMPWIKVYISLSKINI